MTEVNIVAFEPDLGINIQSWILYFDNLSTKKKNNFQLGNIFKYLKGEVLKIYIKILFLI